MNPSEVLLVPLKYGPNVQLSDGRLFPSEIDYLLSRVGDRFFPLVHLDLRVIDGRIDVTRFSVESWPRATAAAAGTPASEVDRLCRGVTASDMRSWNFNSTVKLAISHGEALAMGRGGQVLGGQDATGSYTWVREGRPAVLGVPGSWEPEESAGWSVRRSVTDDLLLEVAEVAKRDWPKRTTAVVEAFHTSHRNASRWIGEAQKRGFLSDPKKGEK